MQLENAGFVGARARLAAAGPGGPAGVGARGPRRALRRRRLRGPRASRSTAPTRTSDVGVQRPRAARWSSTSGNWEALRATPTTAAAARSTAPAAIRASAARRPGELASADLGAVAARQVARPAVARTRRRLGQRRARVVLYEGPNLVGTRSFIINRRSRRRNLAGTGLQRSARRRCASRAATGSSAATPISAASAGPSGRRLRRRCRRALNNRHLVGPPHPRTSTPTASSPNWPEHARRSSR